MEKIEVRFEGSPPRVCLTLGGPMELIFPHTDFSANEQNSEPFEQFARKYYPGCNFILVNFISGRSNQRRKYSVTFCKRTEVTAALNRK